MLCWLVAVFQTSCQMMKGTGDSLKTTWQKLGAEGKGLPHAGSYKTPTCELAVQHALVHTTKVPVPLLLLNLIHSFIHSKKTKHPCSLCVSLLRKEADSYLDACRKMCLFLCLKGCRSLMRSSYFISKDKVMQSLKNRNPSHSCLWSFQSQPFEFGGKMPAGNISPLHRLLSLLWIWNDWATFLFISSSWDISQSSFDCAHSHLFMLRPHTTYSCPYCLKWAQQTRVKTAAIWFIWNNLLWYLLLFSDLLIKSGFCHGSLK